MNDRPRQTTLRGLLVRLAREDSAQDLIEYAFLAGFFGIAGVATLNLIAPALLSTYTHWLDPTVGVPSLWEAAPPALSSGP